MKKAKNETAWWILSMVMTAGCILIVPIGLFATMAFYGAIAETIIHHVSVLNIFMWLSVYMICALWFWATLMVERKCEKYGIKTMYQNFRKTKEVK